MEELNQLLNQILGISDIIYNEEGNIEKCEALFYKLFQDNITKNIIKYFFPICSLETNHKKFWFIKYITNEHYDEFDFGKDLLKNYIIYLKEKDSRRFNLRIKGNIQQFGDYKLINEFSSVVMNYVDLLEAINAYLTKDSFYFLKSFKLDVSSDKIQTKEFIKSLLKEINSKKDNYETIYKYNEILNLYKESESKIQNLNEQVNSLNLKNDIMKEENKEILQQNKEVLQQNKIILDENQKINNKIKLIENENKGLKNEINELNSRIDQIDLRDTLKMSFKYLYNLFYSKYQDLKYVNNFWEQINQIENILKKPEFVKFEFILRFINDIKFTKLISLNKAVHDPKVKRIKFEDIRKYLQIHSNDDLNKVVEFFKNLPNIAEYININLMYYFNPEKAEEESRKIINFPETFDKIFN